MPLSRDSILSLVTRREKDEPSPLFGGDLRIRELTRAEFRAVARDADAGADQMNTDRWNGGIFAAGVIDPDTKAPLFIIDDVLLWPHRGDLWAEVLRVANAILALSEVGASATFPGSDAADAG